VVDLVLEGLGKQVGGLDPDFFAGGVTSLGGHRDRALDVAVVAGDAEARLGDRPLASLLDDLRIDQTQVFLLRHADHDDPDRHADLVGCQANAGRGVHRLAHALDQLLD
jgi:hypothetical protein